MWSSCTSIFRRNRIFLIPLLGMILVHAAFIQSFSVYAQAAEISDSVIRFRVLANSNSHEDQLLKMRFKNRFCKAVRPLLASCETREEALKTLSNHMPELHKKSLLILKELTGSSYPYTISLSDSKFPVRNYGEYTFPPGMYYTLVITLGDGAGENWWCVLYPALCFTSESSASFPAESSSLLETSLSSESSQNMKQGITFRFRLTELMEKIFG